MAKDEPDVKVHLTAKTGGCPICGSTSAHTHTQDDWRGELDKRN